MILFLDFDGVMHPDRCPARTRLFEQAPRLAATLAPFPEVRIVLSTAWRNLVTFDQARGCLGSRLAARVCGSTPNTGTFDARCELAAYHRHAECIQWLQVNAPRALPWLALDDRPAWFAPYCQNLICCDPVVGFDASVAARLASALLSARLRAMVDWRCRVQALRKVSSALSRATPHPAFGHLLPQGEKADEEDSLFIQPA